MSTGIIYFSKSNNVRTAAQFLSESLKAETLELKEKGKRTGPIGFMKSGFQAIKKKSSVLIDFPYETITSFDTIYLMTPIWAGNGTPAINAFLDQADLSEKKVIIVTFQADPKFDGSDAVHKYLKEKVEKLGGSVTKTWAMESARPGAYAGEDHLKEQINKVLI